MLTSTRSRLIALVATLLVGVGLMAAPNADAQRGNMVVFGDSIIADPHSAEYLKGRMGLDPRGSSDVTTWCPTSETSFAKIAARQVGLQPRDYSCAGTVTISPGPNIVSQINRAISDRGGLDGATRRVVIQVGFNDTYNHIGRDPMQVRREYVNFMRPQIERIKRAAPNARIQLVGYPTITSNGHVCLVHLGNNIHDRTYLPIISEWENLAQWMNVDLARATRTQFVDLKPATRGNGMCSNDDQRMFAGLIDFHGGFGHMPIHINQRGHAHIGGVVARA